MLAQPAFGQRLKALRAQQGLSQAALADGGMSTGYLSRLESGSRPPTPRVAEHLARRLGVTTSAFDSADDSRPVERSQNSALTLILAAAVSAVDDAGVAELLVEALDTADDCDPALRWQALWLLAQIRGNDGQHEQEYELRKELIALSDVLDSRELQARACTGLSRCARMLGFSTEAREYADLAHELAAEASLASRAGALHALISAEAEAGELHAAQTHATELFELTEGTPGTAYVEALWAAGTVRIRQGDYAGAQDVIERALARLDSHEDLVLWMRLRLAAASLYLQVSQPRTEQIRPLLEEAGLVVDLVGTELHQQEIHTLWAQLAVEEGRLDEAWEMCARIADGVSLLGFRDHIKFEALRGRLQIMRGEREAGIQRLQKLAQDAQDARNVELAAEIWRGLAKTLAEA